jgi:hyperosmotically inducible protein
MKSYEPTHVNRAMLAAIAAAFALGVSGCQKNEPQTAPEKFGQNVPPAQPQPAEGPSSTIGKAADAAERNVEQAGKALDDAAVTAKVKSALVAEPNLKSTTINVDTTAGVVTLKGTADSQDTRQKAEQIATTVEGVRSVRNELVVVRG